MGGTGKAARVRAWEGDVPWEADAYVDEDERVSGSSVWVGLLS
jgi:hypothetical protein